MAERTDTTLLELVGSASVKGVVETGNIQSQVDVVEATTDALEEDDEDAVFRKREDEPAGICKEGRRGTDPVSCPGTASLALGPNDVDTTEAGTKAASNLSPLETEAPLGASYGSAKPLSDQSKAVLSENMGTPLNLVNSQPQTEPLEGSCGPTAKNLGKTEAKSSAVLLGLELDRKKGVVTSMEETAQEVTSLAASVPMPEKEGGQVNGEEKAPAERPGERLVSESLDELEEADEEEEEVTEVAQQESSSEGSHGSQGASPRCRAQSSGEMPPGGSQMSHHSYSKYNTVSYRKIRKGNTKQRVDEFESMMHL